MDMPLEKLVNVEIEVTSASKYAEKSSEAPSAVEIISAEDIHTYGYRTLADALNGLHGIYKSGDRNYTTLGIRGYNNTANPNERLLIMIDGHRMNENVYDSAYSGEEFMLDMNLVDHIEFIPGPGSSIYGANAMMGTINVVSKKGSDIGGLEIETAGGSNRTNQVRSTFGRTLPNGTDILFSATEYGSAGPANLYYPEYDDPLTNNGIAHNMDSEQSRRIFAKVNYQDFTFEGGYVNRNKQVPTGAFSVRFNDPRYETTDTEGFGEVRYDHAFNDKTHLELKGFYQGYNYHGHFPYDDIFGGMYVDHDGFGGRWGGGEATLVTTAFTHHKIVVGTEFQYDASQHLENYDVFGVNEKTHNQGMRSGVYAQDAWQVFDKLTLNAGLRLDQNHMIDTLQLNPRIGVIWAPMPTTVVKLLYGSAFRAPNAFERQFSAFGVVPNADNTEEHIKNYEAVVEWKPMAGVKITGSAFANHFTDVLFQDVNPASPTNGQFVNFGQYRSHGFDIGAEKKWGNGREVKFSFNHTINADLTNGNAVNFDSPKNVFRLNYAEPLFDGKVKLGLENIYVGERYTYYLDHAHPYDVVNAVISSKQFFFGSDISLGIYNLFDAEVDYVGGLQVAQDVIPADGTTFLLTLRKTF